MSTASPSSQCTEPSRKSNGIRVEQLGESRLALADVVDLEAELHRQPRALRLEHGVAVVVEVVDAALRQVRHVPDLGGLPEVVDVLREADLVDAPSERRLDERADGSA